jgi:hypothetical protein
MQAGFFPPNIGFHRPKSPSSRWFCLKTTTSPPNPSTYSSCPQVPTGQSGLGDSCARELSQEIIHAAQKA